MDAEVHRPYGGADVLQLIAEACSSELDWIIYAACVLSFRSLARVGEISSTKRSGVGKSDFSFWGLKRGERWVSRQLGPYAAVWARWLRRVRPRHGLVLGSASDVEEGMEPLLRGTARPEVRWHAWRRAGACFLRTMGLPWRFLCWWGRWETRGGRLLGPGTRPPPPPLRAFRAHLVTKGQWLLTIHMVAPKAPEIFFFIPLAHVASLPAQAVEHPNAILEPNLDSNAHPNPPPAPNPTANPTHDPNPNQD